MDLKKIGNIAFYVVLIGVAIYFVKRKFIVPSLPVDQLNFQEYESEEEVQIFDYQKDIVVVNFWQTWCGPCIHEMPSLNEMNEIWEGIQVICISDESFTKVKPYIDLYPNIHFLSVQSISEFGVTQFPTTYVYNEVGTKVFSKIGSKDWADPNFIATLKKNWSK